MKRLICALLALMLLTGGFGALSESEPSALLLLLAARDFDALFERSTAEMQAALGSADALRATWAQLEAMFGDFSGALTPVQQAEQDGYLLTYVSVNFKRANAVLMIASDADAKLAGLSVVSFENKPAETEPDAGGYIEEPVVLRAGAIDESRGMLTLPEGEGVYPCVIFMHGSGASDMNGSAYGVNVFGGLARLLARYGVASIRFDKYTYAHPELCSSKDFTVMDEYLPDARAALEILEADARIGGVFALGHSLGGRVAPRVMEELGGERFAGAVLVAGTPLALSDIMIRQNKDAINAAQLDELQRAQALEQIDGEDKRLNGMLTAPKEDILEQTLFGISAYYFVDDKRSDVAQIALKLARPLLIVQGGKDFQVLKSEGAEAWRAQLGGAAFVDYAEYPNLTHLLFELEGEPSATVADYAGEPNVSEALARDIAAWIIGVADK